MINRYYQKELANLRELAAEFSEAYPALAPMLAGPSKDPDVERLLEGCAFLTGQLRQKLDDEFPEVIHGLMRLVFPHYLRPVPSSTLIQFTPKPNLKDSLLVPKGTALASIPVEGTRCIFHTCADVEVQPLQITSAVMQEQPGLPTTLNLNFELNGLDLASWTPGTLRVHLAGDYPEAASIYSLILHHTRAITVSSSRGGTPLMLPKTAIAKVGFDADQALFPYPAQAFAGYRILQEYFLLPQKFLFFDLNGLEQWQNRGQAARFTVSFELGDLPPELPPVKKDNFLLHVCPASNLFPHEAEPISVDHRQPEYQVKASGGSSGHFQVHSVQKVTGIAPGTVRKREFAPFELFSAKDQTVPVYSISTRQSPLTAEVRTHFSVSYPPAAGPPIPETLSIEILCTNGSLPDHLRLGDISQPTANSPGLCSFANILAPTGQLQPPLDKEMLWRLVSHLSVNLQSLADVDNLRTMLRLYVFADEQDRTTVAANEKRIAGIESVTVVAEDRLLSGAIVRGQRITLAVAASHFASRGDLFLFGNILDTFLGSYASINSYTRFQIKDTESGEILEWPLRIGDRPLI